MKPARTLLALGLAALQGGLIAATGGGSSSAQSFRLSRDARAVGLGDAYVALANGADALDWNPAGMNSVRALQANATHLSYIQGIGVDSLNVALPIYGLGAWGLGVDYLYSSDDGYDNWGNPTGGFSIFDFSAKVAVSFELPWDMHVGGDYKILRQGYGSQFSMGSGFDLGWQWKGLFKRLDLGVTAGNLGTPVALGNTFGLLPLTLKGGAALHLGEHLLLSADYDHQTVDFVNKLHTGAELSGDAGPFHLAARGGYTLGPQQDLGGLTGLAVGGGLSLGAWAVDYAWQPLGDLGTTHRITLTYSSWL